MILLRRFEYIGLLFLVAVMSFFTSPSFAMSKPRLPPCVSPVQIKMGERIFYIPRQWKVDVTYIKPGRIESLCRSEGTMELEEWSAFISANFFIAAQKPNPTLQIQVFNETEKKISAAPMKLCWSI